MKRFRRLISTKKKEGENARTHNKGFSSKLSEDVPDDESTDTGEPSNRALGTDGIGPLVLSDTCQRSDSGVDLVFVHGLRGSRIKTWSKGDVCWPRDLLPKDISNVRVLTWGYDSSVANAFRYASKESIFGHADTLLNDLARVGQNVVCEDSIDKSSAMSLDTDARLGAEIVDCVLTDFGVKRADIEPHSHDRLSSYVIALVA